MDDHPTQAAHQYSPLDVVCPRCQATSSQPFYGPCPGCMAELRQKYLPTQQEVFEKTEFVPAMNVTPNAVAQKDS